MMYLQEQFRRQYMKVFKLSYYNEYKSYSSWFDAETVPVNTSFLIINKDVFYWGVNSGKR